MIWRNIMFLKYKSNESLLLQRNYFVYKNAVPLFKVLSSCLAFNLIPFIKKLTIIDLIWRGIARMNWIIIDLQLSSHDIKKMYFLFFVWLVCLFLIFKQPNGRFETNKKICLSISGHHPESWQPSWSSEFFCLLLI